MTVKVHWRQVINAWFFLNVSSQIMSLCPYKVLRRPILYALLCCLFYFLFVLGTCEIYHILLFQSFVVIILFDAQGTLSMTVAPGSSLFDGFLTFGYNEIFQVHLVPFLPKTWISPLSREYWFLSLGSCI